VERADAINETNGEKQETRESSVVRIVESKENAVNMTLKANKSGTRFL